MKNLPKDKRDRLLLILLGTVVAVAILWYGLIRPQEHNLTLIARQIEEQERKLETAQRLVNTGPELQQRLATVQAKLQAIEDAMPAGDMYSWIITTIQQFRADRKVEIPHFSRETATEVGVLPKFPYKAVLFSLRGSAHFHEFGRFLADFENTFPYLRVQNLELESAASSGHAADPEKLGFKMEIVALTPPSNR